MAGGGGGFLLGADDVVQAFRLPKYQHANLSEPSIAAIILNRSGVMTPTEDAGHEPPKDFTYDLHTMDVDSDIDMEEVTSFPAVQEAAPKTMQEMAEDAAKLRIDDINGSIGDEVIDTDAYRPSPPPQAPDGRARITITVPSKVKGQKPSTSQSNTPVKQAPRARPSKRGSANKRRRDDEESEISQDETQSSSKRRVRSKPHLPAPAVPTRTLRPRAAKTTVQLDEEREQEEAYRRATAK